MKDKIKKRNLSVPMREEEYAAFLEGFKGTVSRTMSSYARKMLLGKPVKVIVRNRSLDDFIELGVAVRKELRELVQKDFLSAAEWEQLTRKIDRIEEGLIKIVEQCSRK